MAAAAEIEKDVWQYWSDNRLGNDSTRKIEGWDLFHDQLSSLCNKTLEGEVQSGPGTYIVSMRTGTQVNKGTGYKRKVRRVVWEWKNADGKWGGVYTCADALKLEQAFGARVQATNLPNPNVDPNVLTIVGMGFERADAEAALLAFNNDFDRAIDALCSGMSLPGVPGRNVLKIVQTSQGRSFVFHSDGSVAQQGPVALRPLRRNTNNTWEISLDAGWSDIQAQEAALIEGTLQTLNLQLAATVQLPDSSVVLEEVGDMRRVESGSVRGAVLRWELPAQRQEFLREGLKMRRKAFSDSLWMWEETQGPAAGSYVPYGDDVCKQLDTMCQVSGVGASQKGTACYIIDAQAMQQINTNTGFVRKVRSVGWTPVANSTVSLSSEQIKAIEAAFLLGKRKYVRVQMGGGCCHVSVRDRTYVMIRTPAIGGPSAEVTSAPKGIVRDATGWRYLDEQGVLQRFDAADCAAIDAAHSSLYRLDIGGGYVVDLVKKNLMTVPGVQVVCRLHRRVFPEDCGEGEELTTADSNAAAAEAVKADAALELERQEMAAAAAHASKKSELEAQVQTLQEQMRLMQIEQRNNEMERRALITRASAAAAAAAEAAAAEQKKLMDAMLIRLGAKAPHTAWDLLEIENAQVFATGSFKRVYRATWRIPDNLSAISALNRQDIGGGGVDQEKRLVALLVPTNGAQMEHEIKILEFLGPHPHITALLATSMDDKSPPNKCMLMEYARKGSLDTVLADIHDKTQGYFNLNSVLLTTAMQVADAMKQLALKNLTHRDLATRNVLVFSYPRSESLNAINDSSNVKVKLTDFGSSIGLPRDPQEAGFAPEAIQINRWMAPESLTARREDAVFSERSDVWSFGILLWELWALTATGSALPYQDIADDEVWKSGVIDGSLRLKGVECPGAVDAIMTSCFERDPQKRPKFENLAHSLIQAKAEQLKAEENAGNDDDKLCCFCITNPKTMIIQPCGHWCICEDCRVSVTNECPMCRGPVASIQRLYGI